MTRPGGRRDRELERLFPGDSELAGRMRAFDWSKSDLGPPETWPQNLRIAVSICLTSRFPMHVWWGPNLTLFSNDAYITFLGRVKHPGVLGRSGREAWSEIWDTIGPTIGRVRTTRTASWSEDILMFFDRELPQEEVYVTFSFSPVLGEGDTVDGQFLRLHGDHGEAGRQPAARHPSQARRPGGGGANCRRGVPGGGGCLGRKPA